MDEGNNHRCIGCGEWVVEDHAECKDLEQTFDNLEIEESEQIARFNES